MYRGVRNDARYAWAIHRRVRVKSPEYTLVYTVVRAASIRIHVFLPSHSGLALLLILFVHRGYDVRISMSLIS